LRVLFACAAEYGHLNPQLPLARALADAGHEVAFAIPESFVTRVERAGFTSFPVGLDRAETRTEIARRHPDWAGIRGPEILRFALTQVGAGISAPTMLAGLVNAGAEWQADLLIHGPATFAGPLAAAIAGIPSVNQSWGPLLDLDELRMATDAAGGLWRENGLEPAPFGGMFDHLYLDVCPPLLQVPEIDRVRVRQPVRPVAAGPVGNEKLPGWVEHLPARPTVYVTLGTFYNRSVPHFAAILAGLSGQSLNVIVTVGYDQDPEVLGPQPDNAHIERYIPASLLLPLCDAMITHGGSGSVLGALALGVPILVVPLGADHFHNARRCVAAGVGLELDSDDLKPESVGDGVAALLDDPAFGSAARRVQEEIRSMPGPADAVPLLEHLGKPAASED